MTLSSVQISEKQDLHYLQTRVAQNSTVNDNKINSKPTNISRNLKKLRNLGMPKNAKNRNEESNCTCKLGLTS